MTESINRIPLFVGTLLLATIALSSPAQAIPTITCHCFTDRSYDPARPALADPYFLAMTQNTLFALTFKIDKKTVVIKKQQGVKTGATTWGTLLQQAKIDPRNMQTEIAAILEVQTKR